MATVELRKKHSLLNRWTHWINFPVLMLMVWSGLLIYWANDVYRVGWGEKTWVHFFPEWLYNLLGVNQRLAEGMAIHFLIAWLFVINGALYVGYLLLSGEWRQIVPKRSSYREAWQVFLHDLGVSKQALPLRRYNGAQRIAYTAVILMGAGSVLTGFAIYRPVQLGWITAILGGYRAARLEHFLLALGFVSFFVIHVLQVIKAGFDNFRSMVAGYEPVKSSE